jgi:hypothetical protein
MPRSASTGVYTAPSNSFGPAVAGTTISSAAWNSTQADYVTALTHSASTTRALYPTTAQVQDGSFLWGGTAGGTANARTITLAPAIAVYATGQCFAFLNGTAANTGAATLAVNGLAAQNILRVDGGPLLAGDIPANSVVEVQYDGTSFRQIGPASKAVTRGAIAGLVLSNNATDAVNDLDVATGIARADDNTAEIALLTSLTKQLDVAWAAGTNQGMRDTGAIANGTWHIHLILNLTTNAVDVLASLSATAPTLPSGFTKSRRIGAIIRAAGTILGFAQRNNAFLLNSAIRDINNVTSSGTSAVLRTLSVPSGVNVIAMVRVNVTNSDLIQVGSPSETLAASTNVNASLPPLGSSNGQLAVWTNLSSQIQTRQSAGTASEALNIHTFGWTDLRGEFS